MEQESCGGILWPDQEKYTRINPEKLFNMDELGFQIKNCPDKIIAQKGRSAEKS
jgi:hypothetical protein